MKNILVFGGAGFLGTNLCLKLLNQGYSVTCMDNFISSDKGDLEKLIIFER